MSSDDERGAHAGGSSSNPGRPSGDGGSHHERSGNQALDAAFDAAHEAYKRQKKELKHRKSSIRRKHQLFEEEEEALAKQRAELLADLRTQVERGDALLETEVERHRSVALAVAELRGRLSHTAKEQAQWEQDLRGDEQRAASTAMVELRRLRKARPDKAAREADRAAASSARARLL